MCSNLRQAEGSLHRGQCVCLVRAPVAKWCCLAVGAGGWLKLLELGQLWDTGLECAELQLRVVGRKVIRSWCFGIVLRIFCLFLMYPSQILNRDHLPKSLPYTTRGLWVRSPPTSDHDHPTTGTSGGSSCTFTAVVQQSSGTNWRKIRRWVKRQDAGRTRKRPRRWHRIAPCGRSSAESGNFDIFGGLFGLSQLEKCLRWLPTWKFHGAK